MVIDCVEFVEVAEVLTEVVLLFTGRKDEHPVEASSFFDFHDLHEHTNLSVKKRPAMVTCHGHTHPQQNSVAGLAS